MTTATQVQFRRGTKAQNDAFTGAQGEVTMDLTDYNLRLHDGATAGGKVQASKAYVDTQVSGFATNAGSSLSLWRSCI